MELTEKGIISKQTNMEELNNLPNLKDNGDIQFERSLVSNPGFYSNKSCINCSNNPKNGGSGICHFILGQQVIY